MEQIAYHGRGGDVAGKARVAPARRRSRPVEALLDRHRHAVEDAFRLPGLEAPVGGSRRLAGTRDVVDDYRIEGAIVFLDLRPGEIEQLARADLA